MIKYSIMILIFSAFICANSTVNANCKCTSWMDFKTKVTDCQCKNPNSESSNKWWTNNKKHGVLFTFDENPSDACKVACGK